MQQALIAGAGLAAEIIRVLEIHVDRSQPHRRSGDFGREAQRDPFFRLDVHDQLIGHEVFNRGIAEQDKGSAPKLNDHGGAAAGQSLTGAQVKRHICPSPVVDLQLHGYKGFILRVVRHALFFTVARNPFPIDES